MKRLCAWCNKDLTRETDKSHDETAITHGICRICIAKLFTEMKIDVKKYLDSLPAPVLMVDHDGIIKTGNKAALSMLKKDLSRVENFKGGDVFECVYASLPEGCGKTVHCSGCTIRKSVMATFETGRPLYRSPAYLKQGTSDNITELAFLISTEKAGDIVLLRIDDVVKQPK